MRRKLVLVLVLAFVAVLAAACGGGASQEFVAGTPLLNEQFNESAAWETFVEGSVDLQVSDGVYRIRTGDEGYIWGLNDDLHGDVVMEVTTNQLSSHANNAYGVMCRSDTSNNGDGYYFLISGDGYYSISKGEGEDINPLVDWDTSSTINEGQATNTIRAVCAGSYLALYVNGKFVADAEDSDYKDGFAGFAAAAFEGGSADITFDNLTISTAEPAE